MSKEPESNDTQAAGIVGLIILACFLICLMGVIFAIASCYEDVDLTASAICLIPPAIVMGLLAIATVRR